MAEHTLRKHHMSFSMLGLSEPLVRAVADQGYSTPTPIQAEAIPLVLAGGDLLAGAQTGTGKTAGFVLPMLQRLSASAPAAGKRKPIRGLVLVPTRELAAQVEASVKIYGKHLKLTSTALFGGVGFGPQVVGAAPRRGHPGGHARTPARPPQPAQRRLPHMWKCSCSTKPTACSTWASSTTCGACSPSCPPTARTCSSPPRSRRRSRRSPTSSSTIRARSSVQRPTPPWT